MDRAVVPRVVGLALALAALVTGVGLGYRWLLRRGQLLLRLEAMEVDARRSTTSQRPLRHGVPSGTLLSDFELPDLNGHRLTLSGWRGRRLALMFVDPACAFSCRLLADLAALPQPDGGRPWPLLVSTGDPGENRRLVNAVGLRCPLLLQEGREVARLYRVHATPAGYLIDEDGRTAGELALGGPALLALATGTPIAPANPPRPGSEPVQDDSSDAPVTPAPVEPRANRSGLPVGSPAPNCRLPWLDGGGSSLDEYRGRRVLLVFSDPACAACDALAPRLEQLHRASPDIAVVMVSRGDPLANRAVIAEHDLTFPVALQRQREIARAFGMFATPSGYLIDERGLTAAEVAVGIEAVMALAARAVAAVAGREAAYQHGASADGLPRRVGVDARDSIVGRV